MPISNQVITACAIIYDEQGRIMIAKRASTKKFLPNKFELVGGHVEFGETLEEALQREIQEEIHANVSIEEPIYAFTYLRDDNTKHAVEIDYLATLAQPKEHLRMNPEDHSEIRWISADEVDTYLIPNDEETQAVRRAFEILKTRPNASAQTG